MNNKTNTSPTKASKTNTITCPLVQSSTDYDGFAVDPNNRRFRANPRLKASMQEHGFLPECPIVVVKDDVSGRWLIRNGAHRFHYAVELELPVFFIEATKPEVSVISLNNNQANWVPEDYIEHYCKAGSTDYIAFAGFMNKARAFRSKGWGVMGVTTAAALVHYGRCPNGGGCGKIINDGLLVAKHVHHAMKVLSHIGDVHAEWDKKGTGLHLKLDRAFLQIVDGLIRCQAKGELLTFDWSRFNHVIANRASVDTFAGAGSFSQHLSLLQTYYNHGLAAARKVTFKGFVEAAIEG